ncbi:OmpA family protein [Reinekea marinisedimentorum]|uniref:OmpA family protein n=1 Tax=Reinekea marinisedimentorum TaxID=230495 RepID=A0A4R3IA77_9GAMM|nr:OmpA family protein [Reinekea marinisedimentorum]TCS42387.1 OmpA family protein [Reinekea marinisedimentorum]
MAIRAAAISGLTAVLLSSCAQWPEKGVGGDAERYVPQNYYLPAATVSETKAHQQSQLEILQAQLDVLSLQGAKTCLPASVKRLFLMSHRVRRQIDGGLLADAGHDLVAFQHELRLLRQQFISVAQQTGCNQPYQDASQPLVALISVYFDIDSTEIQPTYLQQLQWWVSNSSAQAQWRLHGYTDNDGSEVHNQDLAQARVKAVKDALIGLDIKPQQLSQSAEGEAAPLLMGTNDFSMGLNRRVDIYLTSQTQTTQGVPVQQWEELNLKTHRHLMPDWE